MPLANYVARARKRLKLTQIELGDTLGVSRWTIARLEEGRDEDIPERTRLAIAGLLTARRAKRKKKQTR
jgi:DNA-binding XRE family transcriptional regulator